MSVIVVGGGKRQEEPQGKNCRRICYKAPQDFYFGKKKVAAKNWLGFYLAAIKGALVGVG